jgi:hypothetical protein
MVDTVTTAPERARLSGKLRLGPSVSQFCANTRKRFYFIKHRINKNVSVTNLNTHTHFYHKLFSTTSCFY